MSRRTHYSPAISRFVVSALYHEAKARKVPMTKLIDTLLRQALLNSEGWNTAQTLRVAEEPPTYGSLHSAA